MSEQPSTDQIATPQTDAAIVAWTNEFPSHGLVPVDFARAQERRIAELVIMLRRCEMWISTKPDGQSMTGVVRMAIEKAEQS